MLFLYLCADWVPKQANTKNNIKGSHKLMLPSLSLSIYIYVYIHIYMCVYIYIYTCFSQVICLFSFPLQHSRTHMPSWFLTRGSYSRSTILSMEFLLVQGLGGLYEVLKFPDGSITESPDEFLVLFIYKGAEGSLG